MHSCLSYFSPVSNHSKAIELTYARKQRLFIFIIAWLLCGGEHVSRYVRATRASRTTDTRVRVEYARIIATWRTKRCLVMGISLYPDKIPSQIWPIQEA